MLNYSPLNGSDYTSFRDNLLMKVEGASVTAYYDLATPPNPTIGIGFNLFQNPTVLQAVLSEMGLPEDPQAAYTDTSLYSDQQAAQAARDAEQQYLTRITTILNTIRVTRRVFRMR